MIFKSGYVSILGRPNVGKSTLLNTIVSQKISITSPKPQTTRNTITGIHNQENAQILFIDTPGIHKPRAKEKLNRYMVSKSMNTIDEVDIILFMTDMSKKGLEEDKQILSRLTKINAAVFLLINKTDLLQSKEKLLPFIEQLGTHYSFAETFPLSAKRGDNLSTMLEKVIEYLPEGPRYFPEDMITDRPEYFLISEIIREKIIILTRDEMPYASAVSIQKIEEKKAVVVIDAVIYIERKSQKGIIIGTRGAMLKEIGKRARKDIELLLDQKVYLNLWVKVQEKWTTDMHALKELGYN